MFIIVTTIVFIVMFCFILYLKKSIRLLMNEIKLLQRIVANMSNEEGKDKTREQKSRESYIEEKMLIECVPLLNIPFHIRISSPESYIYACRVSRNVSKERYSQDLETLRNDIARISDPHMKKSYQRLYSDLKNTEKYIKQ